MELRPARRLLSSICLSCRTRLQTSRPFSSTISRRIDEDAVDEDDDPFAKALRAGRRGSQSRSPNRIQNSSGSIYDNTARRSGAAAGAAAAGTDKSNASQNLRDIASVARIEAASKPTSTVSDAHHLNVYATKHNTHITLTKPNREPLLSVSAGNIGFRKSQRGSFDAAYQLASYSMGKMHERGMLVNMEKLEVVLRGYGAGREAFQKALMGTEGRGIKGKVTRVTDSTRLKFGGTRSKQVRRL